MSYEFEPMDRWQSLRQRLAEGPRPQDEVYTFSEGPQEGQQALWTLSGIRADYLEDLLAERDAAVAEVEQLEAHVKAWGEHAMEKQAKVDRLRDGIRWIVEHRPHDPGDVDRMLHELLDDQEETT